MFSQRPDYVSLNVNDGATSTKSSSRSIWRQWNQLSRFQRNIFYFTVITILIVIIYLLPNKNANSAVRVEESDYDNAKIAQPHPDKNPAPEVPKKIVEQDGKSEQDDIGDGNDGAVGDGAGKENNAEVIDEPDFQPEANHVEDDQIGEPPQHKLQTLKFDGPQNERQETVIKAFKHSWNGYKTFAWGHDNVKPISRGYHNWFGLGLTIVDALDTMYIMGLHEEFEEAKSWVQKTLSFDHNGDVNLFEVTIRVLGGLLAAYHLSGDKMFLNKAIDLGDRMLPAFSTRSGVPFSDVNLGERNAHAPKWGPDSTTSEITSIQLEFRDLSRSSRQPRFERTASKVSEHVHRLKKYDGLVPIFINANTGLFRENAVITLGARGDSYYEYLLKQWIQTGKTIDYLKDDYLLGIDGTLKHLVNRTAGKKFLFISELTAARAMKPKMDHLTCYLSGTLALGVHFAMPKKHMDLATDLLRTCYETYVTQPTCLAPEITYFNIHKSNDENQKDMYVKANDAHNLLRPEFIESLYYMWYFTGNRTYQDWGWQIFEAFEKYTKVEHGYTSIGDVRNVVNRQPRDITESFWFAETLKYLYLLFDDSRQLIDLDRWIFNSEGHPLPIYDS
ncbi:hypothetical protein QAD02_008966 [Eretmocerus hayati]|uniref:Uncharacterized protein n=1 Tax=Eretmocerus hayati TaxID=131215 RepID=A0ACC2N8C6_9HYME|nr:hypothetical protein QAD02_008966 [Eretmocerus hayati]